MASSIQNTTDYDQFKTKKGNRRVVPGSVLRLVRSIQKHNMLEVNPIIVNLNKEVIDGQHRLEAARKLGLPIHYVIFDPASLTEIQLLNANVKVWSSTDFMDSYVATGRQEYKIFKEFRERFGFPHGATIMLLSSPFEGKRPKQAHQLFKEGKLIIVDLERSQAIAEEILRMFPHINNDVRSSNRFYDVMIKMILNYKDEYEKLLVKLAGSQDRIHHGESMNDYIQQFEGILNRGNLGKRIIIY